MRQFTAVLALALFVAGGSLFAQDKKEAKKIDFEKIVCPMGGEKCEGECKKKCDAAVETANGAMGLAMEKFKKEGLKCPECEKPGVTPPCDLCVKIVTEVAGSTLKKQMTAKDAMHGTNKCTLSSGVACKGCSEEMADSIVKKAKEALKK